MIMPNAVYVWSIQRKFRNTKIDDSKPVIKRAIFVNEHDLKT